MVLSELKIFLPLIFIYVTLLAKGDAQRQAAPPGYKKFNRDYCYYKLLTPVMTFNQSVYACRAEGSKIGWRGSLAEARTKEDYDFMYSVYNEQARTHAWIGARTNALMGAFYWLSDGYPVDPKFYFVDQPNDNIASLSCLTFLDKARAKTGYDDYPCHAQMQPFCKICPDDPTGCDSNPQLAGGAYNTLSPTGEIKTAIDTEKTLKCDEGYEGSVSVTCTKSSEAGGLPYWKVTSGVCKGRAPAEFKKYEKDGCVYGFVKLPANAQFETAVESCKIEGHKIGQRGLLAEARTEEDRNWLLQLFRDQWPGYHAWLGGKADAPKSAFYWLSDNYPVDNYLFQEGQPDEHFGSATGVMLYLRDRTGLDDFGRDNRLYPTCKFCPDVLTCDGNPHLAAGAFNTKRPADGIDKSENATITLDCQTVNGYQGSVTMRCTRNSAGILMWKKVTGVCAALTPSGWKRYNKDQSDYRVLTKKLINYQSAVEQCRIEGDKLGQRGTLAEPRTRADFNFMHQIYKTDWKWYAWLGGRAKTTAGAFYWLSDDYPMDFNLFHVPEEPNQIGVDATCLMFYVKERNGIDEWHCELLHYPFCRLNPNVETCEATPHLASGAFNTKAFNGDFDRNIGSQIELNCQEGYDGKVILRCSPNSVGNPIWKRVAGVCQAQQIPSNWTQHKIDQEYYHIITSRYMMFDSAEEQCRIEGDKYGYRGTLAEPRTKADFAFMKNDMHNKKAPDAWPYTWLGARAHETNGAFYWLTDNYPVDNTLWYIGQPDEIVAKPTCLMFYAKDRAGLDDLYCFHTHYPFCRFSSAYETCDSNPHLAAKAFNTRELTGDFKKTVGTKLELKCDAEGYSGSVTVECVRHHYRQLPIWKVTAGSCWTSSEYDWRSQEDGCYHWLMKDVMNWKAAKEQCMIEGHRAGREGQLVETRTRDKLSNSLSIYKEFRANRPASVWIGAKSDVGRGPFYWQSDRTPVDSSLWIPGQPDDGFPACVTLLTPETNGLHDIHCSSRFHPMCSICKFPSCNENPAAALNVAGGSPQKFTSGKQALGSKVEVTCPSGYKGSVTVQCVQVDGVYVWKAKSGLCTAEAQEPKCDKNPQNIDSHALPPTVSFSRDVGSIVPLQCEPGFKLSSESPLRATCNLTESGGAEWFVDYYSTQCTINEKYCDNRPEAATSGLKNATTSYKRSLEGVVEIKCEAPLKPARGDSFVIIYCVVDTPKKGKWFTEDKCI